VRIYILPYTFKNYVSFLKRGSGVDAAMLNQFKVLKEMQHEVRLFVPFGNLHNFIDEVDYFSNIESSEIEQFVKTQRIKIKEKMIKSIIDFSPDVILSNYSIENNLYKKLMSLNVPIVYNSHSVPGFFSDITSANLLSSFINIGNTLVCVSNYHADRTKRYYSSGRTIWTFTEPIECESIMYPAYIDLPKTVVAGDGMIRHVSAANKDKQTFLIHKLFENSEVFTTVDYLGGKMDEYVTTNLKKYSHKTRLDVPHADMMETMKHSSVAFVGLAPYDTFTITSLEALSNGIPLIVKGYKGTHPAYEMVEPEFRKYIHVYENKKDFVDKANEFMNITLDERQSIADSTYRVMNKNNFYKNIETTLLKAIDKFNKTKTNTLESFFA
jgi:hypothetical protein